MISAPSSRLPAPTGPAKTTMTVIPIHAVSGGGGGAASSTTSVVAATQYRD